MLSFGLTYYLCYLVSFVYPAYASFKALETKEPDDDVQWLTYWVVHSVFATMDVVLGDALGWIPLFYEMKLLFIIWMIVPQFKGAKVLYQNYIEPFLLKHASRFDPIFDTAQKVMQNPAMSAAISLAQTYGPEVAERAMKMATEQAENLAKEVNKSNEKNKEK